MSKFISSILSERYEYRSFVIEIRKEDYFICEVRDEVRDSKPITIARDKFLNQADALKWAERYIDKMADQAMYCPKCGFILAPIEKGEEDG